MFLLLATLCLASAQGTDDDITILDEPADEPRKRRPKRERIKPAKLEVIREIERGTWVQAEVGGLGFLAFRTLKPGVSTGLTVGRDAVDRERRVLSVQASFFQGAHHGEADWRQGDLLDAGLITSRELVQGDSQLHGASVGGRATLFPSRRFGVGAHLSGGGLVVPLLQPAETHLRDVVKGEWGGVPSVVHDRFLGRVQAGPSLIYYTKLSHLAVGLDLDLAWTAVLGASTGGAAWVRYTF